MVSVKIADIYINIVYEDNLSRAVAEKLLAYTSSAYKVKNEFSGRGFGYIKSRLEGFNKASKYCPFFILYDLDNASCAPQLIDSLFKQKPNRDLIFRVPIREMETWLIEDHIGVGNY